MEAALVVVGIPVGLLLLVALPVFFGRGNSSELEDE